METSFSLDYFRKNESTNIFGKDNPNEVSYRANTSNSNETIEEILNNRKMTFSMEDSLESLFSILNSKKNNKIDELTNILKNVIDEDEDYYAGLFKTVVEENGYDNVKKACQKLFVEFCNQPEKTKRLLILIRNIPYINAKPECVIICSNAVMSGNCYVVDEAVKTIKKWNSKDLVPILKSISSNKKWLQNYIEKVIILLNKEG